MLRKFFETGQWLINIILIIAIAGMGIFLLVRYNKEKNSSQKMMQTEGQDSSETSSQGESTLTNNTEDSSKSKALPAQSFSLTDLEGETVALSDFSGMPIMVNFWATWCPPCRAEMPLIQDFAAEYKVDLVVLAVNAGEEEVVVQNFVNNHNLDDLVFLLDPENDVASLYRIPGFPTSLFIDAEGLLQGFYIGELDKAALKNNLEKIGVD